MSEKIELPAFKTEAEEADWWFEHREEHDSRLLKAMEDGSTQRLADVLMKHGLTLSGLKEIAVPIQDEGCEAGASTGRWRRHGLSRVYGEAAA
jgi:predicted class III extradiol MEMO1 family dioxygenase